MELEYAIDVLKDFVRIDRQIRKNQNESDYEQFCENKCKAIEVVLAELEKKDRQLKIKNEYLNLIYSIAFDYDGYNTVESLQLLINELVDFAKRAMKNDDQSAVYFGGEKAFNILQEEIKEEEK